MRNLLFREFSTNYKGNDMKECICIEDVQQPSSVLVDSLVNPTPTKNFGNTLGLSSDLVLLTCK